MSDPNVNAVPAGWYVDPSGLPQQRWWDGRRWTHDVTPMKQDLSQLPAPQFGSYSQPQAIPVRRDPTPEPVLALPATTTQPDVFPTRRQLRREFEEAEAARLAAEAAAAPHPAAPFAMPSADVAAPVAPSYTLPVAEPVAPPAIMSAPAVPAAVSAAPGAEVHTFAYPAIADPVVAPPFAAPRFEAPPIEAPQIDAPVQLAMPTPASPVIAEPSAAVPAPASPVLAAPVLAAPVLAAPATATPAIAAAAFSATSPAPAAAWPFQSAPRSGSAISPSSSSALDPSSGVEYQPFGMIPKTTAGAIAPPDKSETVSVWLIAIMPLIMVGVAVLVVTQLGAYYTRFMQGGLLFVFVLLTVALAVRDSRELRAAGHRAPASPAWILLTPLGYLIARSVRVRRDTGRGTAPLWTWLLVVAAIVAGVVVLPDWVDKIVTVASLF